MDPANTRPLERALAVYEQWLAAGEPVPPERLLEQHADLRDLLEAMLGDRAAMAREVEQQSGDERELGDFRILEEIGRGGMAVVYRARQRSLNRDVALKVLPGHVTLDAEAVARFRREATLAARLDHPNIVAIHAVGSHHDTNYFAMELVDGQPIARVDTATGRVRSVREVVDMCAKVCDALAHAHAQGVLHRDVKPSNILIGKDGQPMLTDFGLARDLRDLALTRAGSFAGTPHYTAPEQAADSAQVDARADVWGLAATLYELLTRARPFEGSTAAAVFDRIMHHEPPDPLRLVPDLSPDLAAIVMKALEKDPARRYQSAAAFGDDLRAFLEYRPVAARRPTAWMRSLRWLQRHPAWRAALVVVLAVLLVGPLLLSIAVTGERDRAVAAQQESRRNAYAASVVAAAAATRAGDIAQAARLLDACPDDLRGFEWRYLQHGLDCSLWTAAVHDAPVTAVAVTEAAELIVTGSELGAIAVIDATEGRVRWHKEAVLPKGVALLEVDTAVGALIAADVDGNLTRLALDDGRVLAEHRGPGRSHSVAFAAGARAVVTTTVPGRFTVLDPRTFAVRSEHFLAPGTERPHAAFVTDGERVAGVPWVGGFAIWRLADGSRTSRVLHDRGGALLTVTPGLGRLAGFDEGVGHTFWDVGGIHVQRLHHGTRRVQCTAITGDGTHLVVGCIGGELQVHDLNHARLSRTLYGHRTPVHSLATTSDGWIVSGAQDGSIKLWNRFLDAGPGEHSGVSFGVSLSGPSFGRSLAVGGDGALFTGGLDGTVRRIDVQVGGEVWQRQLPHWINGLTMLRGGTQLVASFHSAWRTLDAATGADVGEEVLSPQRAHTRRLVGDPGGTRVATLDQGGAVTIRDFARNETVGTVMVCAMQPRDDVGGLAWDAGGTFLWFGGLDGIVRRIDAATLAVTGCFAADNPITDLATDGEVLILAEWNPVTKAGRISRRRMADGELLAQCAITRAAIAVATVADRVALARRDGRLGLHDRITLAPILELEQPAPALWSVVAHPQGEWVALQCLYGEPRVLRAAGGDAGPAANRRRAQAAAARALAAQALAPTGWVPEARRVLQARVDLRAELREAAIAALPPPTGWRLSSIAYEIGMNGDIDAQTRATAGLLRRCLHEAIALERDSHTDSARAALALLQMRDGEPGQALAGLDGPAFRDGGMFWHDPVVHFTRACAAAELGRLEESRAALARLRASTADEPRGEDLYLEAAAKLAAAERAAR